MVKIYVTIIYISINYVLENLDFFALSAYLLIYVHVKFDLYHYNLYCSFINLWSSYQDYFTAYVSDRQEALKYSACHINTKSLPWNVET